MASDKVYIDRIIRKYRRRKIRATLFCLVGVFISIYTYISYEQSRKETLQLTGSLSPVFIVGEKISNSDIKLMEVTNRVTYVMGLNDGGLLYSCAACAGMAFGYCLYLLFGARKERIIVELYEKTKI